MSFQAKDSGAIISEEGEVVDKEQAQEMVRQTIERFGRFLMGADSLPSPGQIQSFAGLPLRMVRFVTEQEARREHCPDIWGEWVDSAYHFEVEVAD